MTFRGDAAHQDIIHADVISEPGGNAGITFKGLAKESNRINIVLAVYRRPFRNFGNFEQSCQQLLIACEFSVENGERTHDQSHVFCAVAFAAGGIHDLDRSGDQTWTGAPTCD